VTPPEYALPSRAQRLDFITEAREFTTLSRSRFAFRFLRRFLRCSEKELDQVMGKIWCDAHPNIYWAQESLLVSIVKSLTQPFYYLATKRLVLSPQPLVDYDIETVDAAYFKRWQLKVYEQLPGKRRVTPSTGPRLPREDCADNVMRLVTMRTMIWLFAAPIMLPWLIALSRRYGRNLVAPYRMALGLYAVFEGHFRRWPTRHYVAYADDHNHPGRYLAFRQNCSGRLAVVQNGERTLHPVYAFAMMDDYLTFGSFMASLVEDLCLWTDRVVPIGALYLNQRLLEMPELATMEKDIDVLFIDQWVWPENGFDEKTGRAYETSFRRLSELKRARPQLRVAYQLRHYRQTEIREALLNRVTPYFVEPVEILGNDGTGESYRNVARARVVVTFQSTLGYEAFFVGRGTKALYANFTSNPYEIYCRDSRFQLVDPSGSPEKFIAHIDYLLDLDLTQPPAEACEHHAYADGKVFDRMAQALSSRHYQ
jgi:hypothetical protein